MRCQSSFFFFENLTPIGQTFSVSLMADLEQFISKRGEVFFCAVCLGHEMKRKDNVQEHVDGKKHKRLVAKFAKSTHYTTAPPQRDWLK